MPTLGDLGSAIYGFAGGLNKLMDDPIGTLGDLARSRLADLAQRGQQQFGGANPMDPNQRALAVQQMVANAPNWMLAMPTVYHGTPHQFSKYDLSKIGTGEGAQAYGPGMYFAENPSTARSYQNALAQDNTPIISARQTAIDSWRAALSKEQDPRMRKIYESNINGAQKELADIGPAKTGNLYSQTLPDSVLPRMLQWDKPLSEQPEAVQKTLTPLLDPKGLVYSENAGQAYQRAANLHGPEKVNTALSDAGIPGLSYLDAGSRSGGNGTMNHVIWDQGLLNQMTPTPVSP